jgi:hypothetical protein
MSGRLINGIRYMYISDNLYFTLRDIFWNADSSDTCMKVNGYNGMLTNNICFEERSDSFQYKKLEKTELEKISRWLNYIKKWLV